MGRGVVVEPTGELAPEQRAPQAWAGQERPKGPGALLTGDISHHRNSKRPGKPCSVRCRYERGVPGCGVGDGDRGSSLPVQLEQWCLSPLRRGGLARWRQGSVVETQTSGTASFCPVRGWHRGGGVHSSRL